MLTRIVVGLLVLVLGPVLTPAPAHASVNADGEKHLRQLTDALGGTGAAWAIVREGTVVHTGVTGRDGDENQVSRRTPFLLGSVSKPMLATLAVQLARTRAINLDTPVLRALPALKSIRGAETITARHLLTHTSGLPFGAQLLDRADSGRTPASVVADLGTIGVTSTPGKAYAYSSLGYLVLHAWLEAVTGEPLSELFARSLPLIDHAVTRVRAPDGKRGPWMPPQPTAVDRAGAGYGYAAGSIRTLAEFARASLADHARLATMSNVTPASGETATGLGWRVTIDGDGTRRVWHTGTVPGYFTAIHMVPSENLAVVFAINRSGVLDESRLYAASTSLLDLARNRPAQVPSTNWIFYAIIAGLVVLAGLSAYLIGRRRTWPTSAGLVIVLGLLCGPLLLAVGMDVPVRYGWLWLPEVVLGLLIAGVIGLAGGGLLAWRGARRAAATPAAG